MRRDPKSRPPEVSNRHRRRRPSRVAAAAARFLLLAALASSRCRAEVVSLTDATFDSVREAFGHSDMLILSHSSNAEDRTATSRSGSGSGSGSAADRKALDEFQKLSADQLLRDKGIMLVAVDATRNRMLATRMGLAASELPSLVYLQGDIVFRYQGDPTSAGLMRSYALQGYLNQGAGEPMSSASYWLLVKVAYLNWLFGDGDQNAGSVNVTALVFGGFIAGLLCCAVAATIVSIRFKGGGIEVAVDEKKKQ